MNALVLRTAGTNCDSETMHALTLCGAKPELLHLSQILGNSRALSRYSIMVIPGGFSYGDDIAAGKILANELKFKLSEQLKQFIREGKLLIGVCNGFQVLVKTGLLPGDGEFTFQQNTTLIQNSSGRFQCEWVALRKESSRASWLKKLPTNFEFPIAHGEGRFVSKNPKTMARLERNKQVVLRYWKRNPNGSEHLIAGICNEQGNVVGLMPHPERFVTPYQHPAWTRRELNGPTPGLLFWQSAVNHAKSL